MPEGVMGRVLHLFFFFFFFTRLMGCLHGEKMLVASLDDMAGTIYMCDVKQDRGKGQGWCS